MATTKLKPIELFVPFTNITRRDEDGAMIVEGYCYVNPRVKGDRFSITRAAMEAATPGYTEFPAIREMHQPIAAGTGLEVIWDEKGCFLRSECVDEGTQKKIDKKVLRGYSIGVNALTVRGDDVESLDWVETSYVDRPKDPDAVFLYRADGFDWDAEVEVEVIEDAPAAAADDAAAAPDRVQSLPIVAPSSSPLPSGEEAPPSAALQSAQAPAEGVSSAPEEPVDVAVMRAALVRSGTPEEMLDQLDVAASYERLTPEQRAAETLAVLEEASDAEARLDFQRAQTTQTVPIRENLDGMPKPPPEQKPQIAPRPLPVPPAKPAPGTGYPPPATGVPPIPPGMMPKRMRGYVGALPDGSWGLFPSVEDETVVAAFMDLGDAIEAMRRHAEPIERVIKHEDGKWVVYSESGRKLGEHDTEEEAKKQLQAIEIEKHKDEEGATQPKKDRAAETPEEGAPAVEEPPPAVIRTTALEMADGSKVAVTEGCLREALAAFDPDPQISRSSERDDVTAALTRAATAEAELARVRSGHEEALTRLAAAEARVQTLERMPAKPIFRSLPPPEARVREFLQNLGRDEDVELERMKAAYPDAKAAAEAEARASDGRDGAAYVRWMTLRAQLAELGVKYD